MYRDLTIGSLQRHILNLAIPAIGMMVFQSTFELIDIFWIGKIGHKAIAAVSASSFILWALLNLGGMVSFGQGALIARRIGEKRFGRARAVMRLSILLALLLSAAVMLVHTPLLPRIFSLMSRDTYVQRQGIAYTSQLMMGSFFLFLFMILGAAFNAIGNNRVFLYILAFSLALNMLLDPVLIFGWFGLPRFGVTGAAMATVISRILGCLVGYLVLQKGFPKGKKHSERLRLSFACRNTWQILRIGTPASLNGFLFSIIYIFLTHIIASFGTEPMAALGLVHKTESLTFFVFVGFSQAASAMVGQNLGAGQPQTARDSVKKSLKLANILVLLIGTGLFFFSPQLYGLFTDNPQVVAYSVLYMRLLFFVLVFHSLEVILGGALRGAGYTLPILFIYTPLTALRIPLAYWLGIGLGLGVLGIWLAIHVTTMLKGVIMLAWFAKRRWYEQRI